MSSRRGAERRSGVAAGPSPSRRSAMSSTSRRRPEPRAAEAAGPRPSRRSAMSKHPALRSAPLRSASAVTREAWGAPGRAPARAFGPAEDERAPARPAAPDQPRLRRLSGRGLPSCPAERPHASAPLWTRSAPRRNVSRVDDRDSPGRNAAVCVTLKEATRRFTLKRLGSVPSRRSAMPNIRAPWRRTTLRCSGWAPAQPSQRDAEHPAPPRRAARS
jgi:hypothetical protein